MKKTTNLLLAVLVIAATIITSCESGPKASKLKGYNETESGLIYKFNDRSSDTTTPQIGSFMFVDMTYGPLEDSIIFNSQDLPNPDQMQIPMMASIYKGDLYEGFSMMHVGDSATFVFSADSVFLKLFRMPQVPPEMAAYEYMYFNIRLKEVLTKEELESRQAEEARLLSEAEAMALEEYMLQNYPNATPTESGLYVIVEKKGSGKSPVAGDKVKIHYTGKLIDGFVFDSSVEKGTPFEFTLGRQQVIRGFDEGVSMMNKGEKAKLIIPSELGYGPRGNSRIPPSSTLIFDIELLDFTKEADLQK